MELSLVRKPTIDDATTGRLFVNGLFECDTLEDRVREITNQPVFSWKVHGETAIPVGRYQVIITMSPRFKKLLPRLIDVPGFDGVLIHAGNTAKDTDGCILVGKAQGNAIIGGTSRPALDKLQGKLQAALNSGQEVYITIR